MHYGRRTYCYEELANRHTETRLQNTGTLVRILWTSTAISAAAPTAGNSLPSDIRLTSIQHSSVKKLKTFLFSKLYNISGYWVFTVSYFILL